MNLVEILSSQAFLSVAATLIGGVWTLIKAGDWYERLRQRRVHRVLEALEAAVETVYREYVRETKASRPEGGLTLEEQQHARELARERATAIARQEGLNLTQELGTAYLDLWTGRLVKKLKRA